MPAPGVPGRVVEQVGQPGRAGRPGEQLEIVADLVQSQLGQLQRLVRRADREVALGTAAGRVDHVGVPAGRARMVGDQGRVGLATGQQRVQRCLVQPPPLPAQHLPGQRLAQQGVPEAELVVVGLGQHAARDQLAQHCDQLLLGLAGHGRQEVEGHPLPQYRGGLRDPPRVRVELGQLPAQYLGEAPRQRLLGQCRDVRAGAPAQQLLEEERVPAGALVQLHAGAERYRPAGRRGKQRAGVGDAEPFQPDMGDRVPALQVRQQGGDGLARGHVLRPVRADQQAGSGQLGDALEQGGALRVGPVQVLEDDDGAAVADQASDQGHAGVQPLDRAASRVGQRGEQVRIGRLGAVQRVEQQLVRAAQRAGFGLPGQYRRVGRQPGEQLGDQPGLADAGLAGDHRDTRPPDGEEPLEFAQLLVAPDHHGAGPHPRAAHGGQGTGGRGPGVRHSDRAGGHRCRRRATLRYRRAALSSRSFAASSSMS